MKQRTLVGEMHVWVQKALLKTRFFDDLDEEKIDAVISLAELWEFGPGEQVANQGEAADRFDIMLNGEVSLLIARDGIPDVVEIGRITPFDTIGSEEMLTGQNRVASVRATSERTLLLRFDKDGFEKLMTMILGFTKEVARGLAGRLTELGSRMPLPYASMEDIGSVEPRVIQLFPVTFIQRHRVVPLHFENSALTLGFVQDPTPQVVSIIRQQLPDLDLRIVRISSDTLDLVLRTHGLVMNPPPMYTNTYQAVSEAMETVGSGLHPLPTPASGAHPVVGAEQQLESLLRLMGDEGASDLHLSAMQKPRWRIDGELFELSDYTELGPNDIFDVLGNIMPEETKEEYESSHSVDFAYAVEGLARYRVSLFRDEHGHNAIFRQVPFAVPTLDKLGAPDGMQKILEYRRGLVLVTGPNRSGKSTTLAALTDHLNTNRRGHIITIEDPIEYMHRSKGCLVNQREVGIHAPTFESAMRSAMRQDPDIIVVGELRDVTMMRLALEAASAGHLVLGTLHTTSAVATIDRVIELFPPDEHPLIRGMIAENLVAVASQVLVRKIGGGRAAAFELLLLNPAIGNLIRQNKTHQIANTMATGKSRGQVLLNDELQRLVADGAVSADDAVSMAIDKDDLNARLTT